MALPTGSGSEVLQRGTIHGMGVSDTNANYCKFDGTTGSGNSQAEVPALHIITIISMIISNEGAAEGMSIQFYDNSNNMVIFHEEIPALGTLMINDRFVLYPGDELRLTAQGTTNMNCVYSYINQDWT